MAEDFVSRTRLGTRKRGQGLKTEDKDTVFYPRGHITGYCSYLMSCQLLAYSLKSALYFVYCNQICRW